MTTFMHTVPWDLIKSSCTCCVGHADCLAYAMEQGCPLRDDMLMRAVVGGHFECVKLLVARGLPEKPLAFDNAGWRLNDNPVGPDQLRCLQYLVDNGRPIHTGLLIWVASSGDVDFVRLLNSRGVPLWTGAYAQEAYGEDDHMQELRVKTQEDALWQQGIIGIPEKPEDAGKTWAVLQYGWAMGAPLTPAMEAVFGAKRAATRATLLCFGVAARLSRGKEASPRQGGAWAVMGRMPIELVEKIVVHADFETRDTLHRQRGRECSVIVQLSHPPPRVWMQNDDTLQKAFERWAAEHLPFRTPFGA
jgi:hypothetical protein